MILNGEVRILKEAVMACLKVLFFLYFTWKD
jgi:hypothetical protein